MSSRLCNWRWVVIGVSLPWSLRLGVSVDSAQQNGAPLDGFCFWESLLPSRNNDFCIRFLTPSHSFTGILAADSEPAAALGNTRSSTCSFVRAVLCSSYRKAQRLQRLLDLQHSDVRFFSQQLLRIEMAVSPVSPREVLLADIELVSQDARAAQHQVLQSILEENGGCHYLQKLGLGGKRDLESFKATVPLSGYKQYEADIQRLMDGDKSPLLSAASPIAFASSSGTTGGLTKHFPLSEQIVASSSLIQAYGMAVGQSAFPSKLPPGVGKVWSGLLAGTRSNTKGGLKVSTVSTIALFFPPYIQFLESVNQAVPLEVMQCTDIRQAIYAHLLCALSQAHALEAIVVIFAFSLVEMFRCLETVWPSLCHDIRTGQVNTDIVTDDVVRQAILSKVLKAPDPEGANRVQAECQSGQWDGIVLRLFPNLQYLSGVVTGPMAPFAPVLDRYTRNNFPKVAFGYGASEVGHCAFPLPGPMLADPELFVFWPRHVFYEFLAEDGGENPDTPVELTEVKQGLKYEVIVTTTAGLYRYSIGDTVEVTGFYNTIPIFKFAGRKGVLLSINTDKTDETELQMLVLRASQSLQQHGLLLLEYSSYADHSTRPGHYIFYWELQERLARPNPAKGSTMSPQPVCSDRANLRQALQECCNQMDSSLNEPYRRGRRNQFIGPLELRIVRKGTFAAMREYALQQGASLAQYKCPRCVSHPALVEILSSQTEERYHSSFHESEGVQHKATSTSS